jgi:regulator of replication initiation timing
MQVSDIKDKISKLIEKPAKTYIELEDIRNQIRPLVSELNRRYAEAAFKPKQEAIKKKVRIKKWERTREEDQG